MLPHLRRRVAVIVIENPNGRMNAGERAFIAHQRGKNGVALVNFMVGGGGPRRPGREVDVILLLPNGIFAVEVKYTSAVGELDSPLNDSWSVGDIEAPFSSKSRSPATQADQAAKILASALESKDWPKAYIAPVVSIHGKVTIPEKTRWVGTVGVSTVEHFDLLAKDAKTKRIQAKHVGPMLERLGVSTRNVPDLERLVDEGFGDGTEPPPAPKPKPVKVTASTPAPTPVEKEQPWLLKPLPSTPYVRTRAIAITCIVVLIGVWQLMYGNLFNLFASPAAGDEYFIYGTWQDGWSSPQDAGVPGLSAFVAPALGGILGAMFGVAGWLRLRIGPITRLGIIGFLLSVLVVVTGAPVLFSSSQWLGVAVTWLLYTCVWPVVTIIWREVREPLAKQIDRVWHEYEI